MRNNNKYLQICRTAESETATRSWTVPQIMKVKAWNWAKRCPPRHHALSPQLLRDWLHKNVVNGGALLLNWIWSAKTARMDVLGFPLAVAETNHFGFSKRAQRITGISVGARKRKMRPDGGRFPTDEMSNSAAAAWDYFVERVDQIGLGWVETRWRLVEIVANRKVWASDFRFIF